MGAEHGKERLIWNDRIYEHAKSHSVLELQTDGRETETIFMLMSAMLKIPVCQDINVCDFCFVFKLCLQGADD